MTDPNTVTVPGDCLRPGDVMIGFGAYQGEDPLAFKPCLVLGLPERRGSEMVIPILNEKSVRSTFFVFDDEPVTVIRTRVDPGQT